MNKGMHSTGSHGHYILDINPNTTKSHKIIATLCPTLILDLMSHALDCVFQTSSYTTHEFPAIPYITCEFNGNSPEI